MAAAAADSLAVLMAVERQRFTPVTRIVIPSMAPTDVGALAALAWRDRQGDVAGWRWRRRRRLRREVEGEATATGAENDRTNAEQVRLAQVAADRRWEQLLSGEEAVVTADLGDAFADNPAPVEILRAGGSDAALLLQLPGPDVLPDRQPTRTPTGRASTKVWTQTDRAEAYADLLGAHLLATLRETWAVAPSVRDVRVLGVRSTAGGGHELLFDVEAGRDAGAGQGDLHGGRLLAQAIGGLKRVGRTREVAAWPIEGLVSEVADILTQRM